MDFRFTGVAQTFYFVVFSSELINSALVNDINTYIVYVQVYVVLPRYSRNVLQV